MSDFSCLFGNAYAMIGCALGQPFNIYRPNLAVVDQTPTFIATVSLNVVPGGFRQAIPNMFGVSYFLVTGDRSKFQTGDIAIPVNPTSSIPPLTILNYDDGLPCVALRTSRICSITQDIPTPDTLGTNIYTNARFDFILFTTPESGVIDQLTDALGMPNKKAVMWTRDNYSPQKVTYKVEGMRLIETDGINPIRWVIKGVTQIGNLTVFNMVLETT